MKVNTIQTFEETIETQYNNITGIVVQKDGETRYERYFHGYTADNAAHVFSVTKSVFSALIGILGIAVLVTYSPKNGIILLVIAFLVSPVGIPMAAAWLLGIIQQIRFAIQDRVYQ